MNRTIARAAALPIFAALVGMCIVAAACSDDPPTQEEATDNLCTDAEHLQLAVGDFISSISLDSSADDIKDNRTDVSDALDDLRDSAKDVAGFKIDEIEQAWNDFVDAVENIDEADSIGQGLDAVSTAASDFGTTLSDQFSSLDCA